MTPTSRGRALVGARRGTTVVELVVASAVFLVAVSILSSTMVATSRQRTIHRENAIASEAARSVLETMRSLSFQEIHASYDRDPTNDPGGPGTAPGSRFPVRGLSPVPSSPDGAVGEVRFPTRDVGAPGSPQWELREDVTDRALGMPRDLNGDHVVDGEDHSLDYVRLPVAIDLRWSGTTGERVIGLHTMLCWLEYE